MLYEILYEIMYEILCETLRKILCEIAHAVQGWCMHPWGSPNQPQVSTYALLSSASKLSAPLLQSVIPYRVGLIPTLCLHQYHITSEAMVTTSILQKPWTEPAYFRSHG